MLGRAAASSASAGAAGSLQVHFSSMNVQTALYPSLKGPKAMASLMARRQRCTVDRRAAQTCASTIGSAAGGNGAAPQPVAQPVPLAPPQQSQQQGSSPAVSVLIPEGEQRQVLSVFVADEAGLINQVSGVFTAAGRNIESLAVGLNIDTALFTITMVGTSEDAAQLAEQLRALSKVLSVENLTAVNRMERELVLLKVRAPSGAARTEVTQLARIFRARILDTSDGFMTLALTGDAGKTVRLQTNLERFGIVQLARTGTIALKRGNLLLEVTATFSSMDGGDEDGLNGVLAPEAITALAGLQSSSTELWEGKQAVSEDGVALGVLEDSHTLSIEVADEAGALQEVTTGFASMGVNVQSLAVGSSETPGRSRITIVVPRDDEGLPAVIEQMEALSIVGSVRDLTTLPFVAQELMMCKVRCQPSQRGDVKDIAEIFHGKLVDVSKQTVTLELQGREVKMIAAQTLLKEYGILEVARTGRVAMPRDSGVNTRMLNTRSLGRVMM